MSYSTAFVDPSDFLSGQCFAPSIGLILKSLFPQPYSKLLWLSYMIVTLYISLWEWQVTWASAQMGSPKNSSHNWQKNPLTGIKNSEPRRGNTARIKHLPIVCNDFWWLMIYPYSVPMMRHTARKLQFASLQSTWHPLGKEIMKNSTILVHWSSDCT